MPKGMSVYDRGYGIYIPLPKGTVASFGMEFDIPGPGNRHATSTVFVPKRDRCDKGPAAVEAGMDWHRRQGDSYRPLGSRALGPQ